MIDNIRPLNPNMEASTIKVTLMKGREAMHDMKVSWSTLLDQSSPRVVFATYEWAESWLRVNLEVEPLIFVATQGEEVVGFAPLYVEKHRLAKFVPVRVLRVLGDTESAAEYLHPVIARKNAAEVINAIFKFLTKEFQWDLLWLPAQFAADRTSFGLNSALESSQLGVLRRASLFSNVALEKDIERLALRRSKSTRQMLRRTAKQYQDVKLTYHRVANSEDVLPRFEQLQRLHGQRWQKVGQVGAFKRRPKLKSFLTTFLPESYEQGWLNLCWLCVDGEPVAAQLGFEFDQTYLLIQEGFDPGYEGTGNLLREWVMEQAVLGGLHHYDFLGGYSEHKRRWGAERVDGEDVLVTNRSLVGWLVRYFGLWPTGRFIQRDQAP
ncbi:MAG: CelD/BcsL family acetyltransferase involved in cellulose biosynthesis [Candidatus Azotimanducaceae bacterium]|jgi:CelD/BcsL family acetyltransferase involved in cellulose biosynthesis